MNKTYRAAELAYGVHRERATLNTELHELTARRNTILARLQELDKAQDLLDGYDPQDWVKLP